jgi:hypothetical protein
VGCGLFTGSCHVRYREAKEARFAHLASLEVKSIAPDRMDPADVGRMVHLSGIVRPDKPVTDTEVGLTAKTLVLERNVSMFQWIETCDEVWSIGVYRFADFRLPDPAAQQLDPLDVRPADLASLPASIRARARIDGGAIHMGDPPAPRVGDLRVRFRARAEMPDSLVAQRGGSTHTRCPTGGTSSRRAPAPTPPRTWSAPVRRVATRGRTTRSRSSWSRSAFSLSTGRCETGEARSGVPRW